MDPNLPNGEAEKLLLPSFGESMAELVRTGSADARIASELVLFVPMMWVLLLHRTVTSGRGRSAVWGEATETRGRHLQRVQGSWPGNSGRIPGWFARDFLLPQVQQA